MSRLKPLSAALIAVAVLVTPALARENHITSRHLTQNADANTTIGGSHNNWRSGDRSDVWGRVGGYYGPTVHAP
jgi:hypothetical protein